MAGKKVNPEDAYPLNMHWVCEGCQNATLGVNPPDTCRFCEHEYFSNLQDDEDEKASVRH